MSLDMFFEILRALEGFATEFAFVRFQGNMDTDVRCDMVAFHCCGTAATPLTRQIEIVGTLAADVSFADMLLCDSQYDEVKVWAPRLQAIFQLT